MFDLRSKSKFCTKCNALIRMTEKRLEGLRKKKETVVKFLKKDIADLINAGLDYDAYSRVEGLILELNVVTCYEYIDRFCACITDNLSVIYNHKDCPKECQEAIQSLICAAARFSEIPELRGLRSLLSERYGTSLELLANKEFVDKLKPHTTTKEMKFQLMHGIAQEFSIEWRSKSLEHKLFLQHKQTSLETKGGLDKNDGNNVSNVPSCIDSLCSSSNSMGSASDDKQVTKKDVSYRHMPPSGDQNDEEDKALDSLLIHYSKNVSPYNMEKLKHHRKPPVSLLKGETSRKINAKSKVAVIPGEAEVTEGRSRASTLQQPQKCDGIVHPNLPDYDDLASRIAAFNGR